jgi:hypothetical protein
MLANARGVVRRVRFVLLLGTMGERVGRAVESPTSLGGSVNQPDPSVVVRADGPVPVSLDRQSDSGAGGAGVSAEGEPHLPFGAPLHRAKADRPPGFTVTDSFAYGSGHLDAALVTPQPQVVFPPRTTSRHGRWVTKGDEHVFIRNSALAEEETSPGTTTWFSWS